jgi:hypothetical protein
VVFKLDCFRIQNRWIFSKQQCLDLYENNVGIFVFAR